MTPSFAAASPSGSSPTGVVSADGGGWPGRGAPTVSGGSASSSGVTVMSLPSGYSVSGIDVSSHDHDGKTINWATEKANGLDFAFVKATEGTSYVNPYYSSDYASAKNNGIYTGAYAWGRPDLGNPVGQANHLADTMAYAHDGRTLPPFLDIEWPYSSLGLPACYGLSTSQMVSWISSFLTQVKARIGVTPMIYTNVNWWNPCTGSSSAFGGYPLDISTCNSSPPSVPGWGTNWTFWQYDIPDCGRGSTRDYDVYRGSLGQLAQLAGRTLRDDIAWYQNPTVFTFSGTALSTIGSVPGIGVPEWAGVGDYNHDGRDDLYWFYGDTGTMHVLTSTGSTFVSIGAVRGPGIGHPVWAGVGDFDGDGYRDDIAWYQSDGRVYTFSGTGLPTAGSVPGIGVPTWAGVGDYNHDGRDDLYWFYGDTGTMHVLTSTGSTFVSIGAVRGPGIGRPVWAGVGDFDGDGYRDDIAWYQSDGHVFTFSGTALATAGSVPGIGTPEWAGVGDYNHDGRDDLYWYYGDTGTMHVLTSTGPTFVSIGAVRGPGIGHPAWAGVGSFN
jgi:GH25 family lysozyme M1 (1,4-beta-N-acetylmuramidase)